MDENTNLNAAQLQRIQHDALAALQVAIDRMQLRKWAVEQAFAIAASYNRSAVETDQEGMVIYPEPMKLAVAVYDFVSQAAVVKVDVSGQ